MNTFFDKLKPQAKALVKVDKSTPKAFLFLGETCCLITTATASALFAKFSDDPDAKTIIEGLMGIVAGSLISAVLSCCVTARLLCPTITLSIDKAQVEAKVKEILISTLKAHEIDIEPAELNHYFKEAEEIMRQKSKEELEKNYSNLINLDAVNQLVDKLCQSVLETKNETQPLLASSNSQV